jgi:hypothetical protein
MSYVGGAMATLFGPAFNGLARRGPQLSVAFAAAHLIHVILIAFGRDFVLGALGEKIRSGRYAVQYVPFANLTVMAVLLRFAAFLQCLFPLRSAAT